MQTKTMQLFLWLSQLSLLVLSVDEVNPCNGNIACPFGTVCHLGRCAKLTFSVQGVSCTAQCSWNEVCLGGTCVTPRIRVDVAGSNWCPFGWVRNSADDCIPVTIRVPDFIENTMLYEEMVATGRSEECVRETMDCSWEEGVCYAGECGGMEFLAISSSEDLDVCDNMDGDVSCKSNEICIDGSCTAMKVSIPGSAGECQFGSIESNGACVELDVKAMAFENLNDVCNDDEEDDETSCQSPKYCESSGTVGAGQTKRCLSADPPAGACSEPCGAQEVCVGTQCVVDVAVHIARVENQPDPAHAEQSSRLAERTGGMMMMSSSPHTQTDPKFTTFLLGTRSVSLLLAVVVLVWILAFVLCSANFFIKYLNSGKAGMTHRQMIEIGSDGDFDCEDDLQGLSQKELL